MQSLQPKSEARSGTKQIGGGAGNDGIGVLANQVGKAAREALLQHVILGAGASFVDGFRARSWTGGSMDGVNVVERI